MPSFEYIESAIVLKLDNKTNLRSFKYSAKDFAKHGESYKFIVNYFDKYGDFPTVDVLCENFPELDKTSQSVNFDYAVDNFKDQVLQRKIVKIVQLQRDIVKDNPKMALANLVNGLTDIDIMYDEDVSSYDSGDLSRLDEWKKRTQKRTLEDGLMGVPTSFISINSKGVGWMAGELIAMFARPTIGKTWMCVHSAATAVKKGFRTLLISTEMPISSISMRLDVVLANMMGYDFSHTALRRGDPINEDAYKEFLMNSNKKDLLVCDHISGQVGISIEAIASLVRKHHPDFVVIDGVYLISAGDSKKAIWEQSYSLFYGLKNLATSTNTPIMVSTQATREAANMFTPPRADQVAFGDALIRSADCAMSMCAIENEPNKRMIQFQKYRDGELPNDITAMQWNVDKGDILEIPNYKWSDDF